MRDRLIKEIANLFVRLHGEVDEEYSIKNIADNLPKVFDIVEKESVEKLTAERDRLREALSWICSESGDERVFNRAVEALSPEPEKVDKGK